MTEAKPGDIINGDSDGTKPVYKILNSTKKVRPDDKRGPRHNHPVSQAKRTAEEKAAFAAQQFRPKWHAHPIKAQILKWVEDGFSAYKIVEKINLKAVEDGAPVDTYSLSLPTVIRIRRRHLTQIGALKTEEVQSRMTTMAGKEQTDEEKILWKTINDCTEKKKDPTISPKDWQYYDQQQQSAITLLNSLKDQGRSGEDIAVVISRVFAQFFKQHTSATATAQAVPGGAANDNRPTENKPV